MASKNHIEIIGNLGAGRKQEQTAEPVKAEPSAGNSALAQNPAVQELKHKLGAVADNQLPF